MNRGTAKIAYAVVGTDKGRTRWLRIGRATVNRDGSLDVRLDAVPIDGRIQIRDEPCDVEGDHPGVKGEGG